MRSSQSGRWRMRAEKKTSDRSGRNYLVAVMTIGAGPYIRWLMRETAATGVLDQPHRGKGRGGGGGGSI